MFCHNCGSQLQDDAVFCYKCGTKVISEKDVKEKTEPSPAPERNAGREKTARQDTAAEPERQNAPHIQGGSSDKKKIGKLPFILGAAALVVIAAIVIALNWGDKIDLSTVGTRTPFAGSQGIPYTYEEVLNQYMDAPEWTVRADGDVHYVDVSGRIKGKDNELSITFEVSPDPDNPDGALINSDLVMVDDVKSSTNDEAVNFLYKLFWAYDEGYSDLSWLDIESAETGAGNISCMKWICPGEGTAFSMSILTAAI